MAAVLTLACISGDVYEGNGSTIVGYKRVAGLEMKIWDQSSFFGALYTQGSIGVIAFRGTRLSDANDDRDDIGIGSGKFPVNKLGDAFDFFSKAKDYIQKNGGKKIIITGHSLGGGLAQVVSARITTFPVVGVTFNAPGMANLAGVVKFEKSNSPNVFNYRSENDPVSRVGKHIGRAPVSIKKEAIISYLH
ncbi:lipase family protein [Methylobacterium sp. J-076]|uniref:lipase family protein n=1 Tax=Methylobacterium sp. J-076 TaxID=2836655 RepID=UPI001FBBDE26|nr:hypothetical protein [Methylobacterium sp. J-076]MCJ2011862.1 hypothetical protein [Methylobacterium sp. J-076]